MRKSKFHKTLSIRDFSWVRGQHWVTCQATDANKTEELRDRIVMNNIIFLHRLELGPLPLHTKSGCRKEEVGVNIEQ